MTERTRTLQGEKPSGEMFFAAWDSSAHHVSGQVCRFRFSATLAPYSTEDAARAALDAEGCDVVVEVGR